jgi:hypothetical protein
MTIKLAAARIDGILKNEAGEVVGHIAYALNDTAVKGGTPALKASGIALTFDDIVIDRQSTP